MSNEAYEEVMKHLTCIEEELNKVAAAVGHVSFDEFMALNSKNKAITAHNQRDN